MKKLLIVLLICLLSSTLYYGHKVFNEQQEVVSDNKIISEIKELAIEPSQSSVEEIDRNVKKAQQYNQDIIGWIYLPDSEIDEPIVYHKNNDFYLRRDLNKEYNQLGSIFMDSENSKDFSDIITYIFGHNTINGKKFGDLNKYTNQDFYDNHKNIIIYTEDDKIKYELLGTFHVEPATPLYPSTKFTKDDTDSINKELSKYNIESISDNDKLLMLITCKKASKGKLRQVVIYKRRGV